MKNKLSALEQLRYEKMEIESLFNEQETRISDKFSYLGKHWGSMLLKSAFSCNISPDPSKSGSSNFISGITSSNMTNIVWTLLQPFLIKLAANKIKGFFSGKKKK